MTEKEISLLKFMKDIAILDNLNHYTKNFNAF